MTFRRGTNGNLDVSENINGFLFNGNFTDLVIETVAEDGKTRRINAHQVQTFKPAFFFRRIILVRFSSSFSPPIRRV
jgi:hypothetical protein